MNIFIKGRRQGKTTKLIITSEITQIPILAVDDNRKHLIIDMAKELGCNIPEPISYRHYMRYPDGRIRSNKFLIDDAEDIIKKALEDHLRSEVVAVTITDKFF